MRLLFHFITGFGECSLATFWINTRFDTICFTRALLFAERKWWHRDRRWSTWHYCNIGRACSRLLFSSRNSKEDKGSDAVDDWEDFAPGNDAEFSKIQKFCSEGSGCNRECPKALSAEKVFEHILNVREMEKSDKDLYLMGVLQNDRSSGVTKRGMKRQRSRYTLKFSGQVVLRTIFCVCYDIGITARKGIMSHTLEHVVVPRNHGNMGRRY